MADSFCLVLMSVSFSLKSPLSPRIYIMLYCIPILLPFADYAE